MVLLLEQEFRVIITAAMIDEATTAARAIGTPIIRPKFFDLSLLSSSSSFPIKMRGLISEFVKSYDSENL